MLFVGMFVVSGLGWGGVSCSCGVVPAAQLQDCSNAFSVLGTRSVKLYDSDAIMSPIRLVDMF